jgi:hypothetical protein
LDGGNLVFEIKGEFSERDEAAVLIEPRRLWPAQKFSVTGGGVKSQRNFKVTMDGNWSAEVADGVAVITIPLDLFEGFRTPGAPMRVNVCLNDSFWLARHPWEPRLRFSDDNPADLGWLFINDV